MTKEEIKETERTRQMMLDTVKNCKAQHKTEIEAVRHLGEQIGYGNILTLALALWTIKLREDGVKRTSPRVITNASCLNSSDRFDAERAVENTIAFIQDNNF